MVTSSRNNRRGVLVALPGFLAAAGLLGVAEGAPATCANPEIALEFQPLEMEYRKNNAVLRDVEITQCGMRITAGEARITGGLNFDNSQWNISGDVRITVEGGSLTSDKAIVTFRNKLLSAATITGSPAQFEQKREDGTMARGRANTIDYETASGLVSFTTNAWLSYGRNEITGQQLVYNIRAQGMQPQAKPDQGNGTGRIRVVIQPDKPPQLPSTDKEKKEKKP
jgi:lipopolysaccharide export system protein LptA